MVRVGPVWQSEKDGAQYLVTRIYSEALATVAVLRPTGESHAQSTRVKIKNSPAGQTLPGFREVQG
jgi:hypothetical protein